MVVGRCCGWSGGRGVVLVVRWLASSVGVGASKMVRTVMWVLRVVLMRLARRVARSEWPPSSKKLSGGGLGVAEGLGQEAARFLRGGAGGVAGLVGSGLLEGGEGREVDFAVGGEGQLVRGMMVAGSM